MRVSQKRATIDFDSDIHRVPRIKAAETDRSVSALVNEAVRPRLANKDAKDLAAFEEGAHKPNLPFEVVLRHLNQRDTIWPR